MVTIETSLLISANKTEITLVLWSFREKRLIKALEKVLFSSNLIPIGSGRDVVFKCLTVKT